MRTDTTNPSDNVPTDSGTLLKELLHDYCDTAEGVVPWFLQAMPRMYFQDTNHETSRRTSGPSSRWWRPAGCSRSRCAARTDGPTAMRSNYPGVLAEIVAELPLEQSLRSATIHSAADGSFVLDTFEFGEQDPFDPGDPEQAEKVQATIEYAREHLPLWTEEEIRAIFERCTADYVKTLTPLRICKHYQLYLDASGSDSGDVEIEQEKADQTQSRITVGMANARTRTTLSAART